MSYGYDNLRTVTYSYAAVNFASGNATHKVAVPRGCQMARVLDIMIEATVTFTQTTTPGLVQVGDGTTAAKFAQLSAGGTASGSTVGSGDQAIWISNYLKGNYNSGAGLHDLTITFVAPTGGTPAGTGNVFITIGYDDIRPLTATVS